MPTTNPRVQIVLDPEVYAIMKKFARQTNSSMSSVIGNMAAEAAPAVHQLSGLMETANGLSKQLTAPLIAKLANAENLLRQSVYSAQGVVDDMQLDVEEYIASAEVAATSRSRREEREGVGASSLD